MPAAKKAKKTKKAGKVTAKATAKTSKHSKTAKSAGKKERGKPASKKAQAQKGVGKNERVEILKKFTKYVLKKYGPIVRSIVLFGSTARGTSKMESDIDVFVIIDDTKSKISPHFKSKIEDDLDVIAKKCNRNLSVQQPYLLTEFWAMVRDGHPIVFNFIREGVPVFDKDIFLPIKRLLQMGEIRPSKEAVEKYIERGPKRIKRVENAKIYMVVEDCYYAMLESAQAVLMFLGRIPPRPTDAPETLRKTLLEMKFVEESDIKVLEDIIMVRKNVEHKKIKKMSGADVDAWIRKTRAFVKKMQNLIVKIEVLKREGIVEKSHQIMSETVVTLMSALKKKPSKAGIVKDFESHLVKPGVVSENYLGVIKRLEEMKKLIKEGKVMDLPKQEILMHREYVRKFIHEAGKILRKKPGSGRAGTLDDKNDL
ncbi:MAG: nucleotidyltransferase domain-containing protein [Candidatus Aenigmarchaeota archaeon]|nr:nucleotidyltransferase domain-containing protein [Candidatus Aenigmarchaeota archaeon]